MPEWRWVTHAATLAAHGEQLAEHGGAEGLRDIGLFESAMARPRNLAAYGKADAAALAASYAYGLARNHPFIDGNKRIALVVAELFLAKNGYALQARDPEIYAVFMELAAGGLTEDELAQWLRERISAA